jgi:hypothetical protein
MRTLSIPTLGLLIDLANDASFRMTEDLWTLMMRCDFTHDLAPGTSLIRGLANNAMRTRTAAEAGDAQAHRNLLRFAQLVAEKRANHRPGLSRQKQDELREALLADGYELGFETNTNSTQSCTLLPTDASPIPLAREITALEHELLLRGYDVALVHYRQAIDTFETHSESTNSQLRTALEELVMHLAEDHTSYTRPVRAGDGANAIKSLMHSPSLADGGEMLTGLWKMVHTNGSHPGRSSADETRFRLHAITATARLLLHRFPSNP